MSLSAIRLLIQRVPNDSGEYIPYQCFLGVVTHGYEETLLTPRLRNSYLCPLRGSTSSRKSSLIACRQSLSTIPFPIQSEKELHRSGFIRLKPRLELDDVKVKDCGMTAPLIGDTRRRSRSRAVIARAASMLKDFSRVRWTWATLVWESPTLILRGWVIHLETRGYPCLAQRQGSVYLRLAVFLQCYELDSRRSSAQKIYRFFHPCEDRVVRLLEQEFIELRSGRLSPEIGCNIH